MSIATSVTVNPSRWLLGMVAAFCSFLIVIAFLLGSGALSPLALPLRLALSLLIFIPAVFGFYHTVRNQKALHIDISASGEMRIEIQDVFPGSCQEQNWPHLQTSHFVHLHGDSTIWTCLLLLRLETQNGKIIVFPVLPDSVSRDGFRALSVACRWIAAQGGLHGEKNIF